MFFMLTSTLPGHVPRPRTAGPFPNRYRYPGIVSRFPRVSLSVSNSVNTKNAFRPDSYTQQEPVRWWIPLVASTGALLVLVLGTAAVVSSVVNSTIGGIG
jgi:hypothetical protein